MDLKSGYPYWTVKNGLAAEFPSLQRDARCDVVVVGAGISGALIARALSAAGMDVVVLDKRDAGRGSTAATTALLQYEIDGGMTPIARRYGEAYAAELFKACEAAIGELASIARPIRGSGFANAQSLQYASWPWHAEPLRREGELRRRHRFDVAILGREEVAERFGFSAPCALLTNVAARMDPYRVATGLLEAETRRGCAVFDRTEVTGWKATRSGVRVETDREATIHCKHLVLAMGYESLSHLRRRVARIHSTYALVTEPIADPPNWIVDTLLWETRHPYLYARGEGAARVVVGGEDDRVDNPVKRDLSVRRKSKRILVKLAKLLGRSDLEIGYAWAGSFAETRDALPFFGPHREHGPRVIFAMAYGGNGIVYSVLGAELIRRRLCRQKHPLLDFLSFDRMG